MLGKTAGGLYWMFRYLERAENTARLIEAGWRIALTRSNDGADEWQSILATAGATHGYLSKHDSYDAGAVVNYLLRDKDNPSSVMCAVSAARTNARLVRTALSSEVWEAVNETWMELKRTLAQPVTERTLHDTLALIRARSSMVRGALHGTMLRNDIYAFARLGTFLERADSTARILDMKYYVLLPSASFVGTTIDNAQWEVILRSVSAERSYRWLSGGEVTPLGIAEFMILDRRMPRSLAYTCENIGEQLEALATSYDTREPSTEQARALCDRMGGLSIEAIFEEGLHEFLTGFIAKTGALSAQIETDFRFYG